MGSDLAVGKGYLVNQFLDAGKKSEEKSVNVKEFLQGTTPAGANRSEALNMGIKLPDDLYISPDMAKKLDTLIDKGYKIMGQKDFSTRLSHMLGGE